MVVSHDRYFMDKLIDHLFIFEGDGLIRDYNGRYSEYRMDVEEKERALAKSKTEKNVIAKDENPDSAKSKKKFTFKEKQEFEKLEKEIAALEDEKRQLTEKLNSGIGDHIQAGEWAKRMQKIIEEVDSKSMRWLELSEQGA